MANDRIYLKCHVCNEAIYLAKAYGEWFRASAADGDETGEVLGRTFYAFMNEHMWCGTSDRIDCRLCPTVTIIHDDEIGMTPLYELDMEKVCLVPVSGDDVVNHG